MRGGVGMPLRRALFSICVVIAALAPVGEGSSKTMAFTKTDGTFLLKFLYEDARFAPPMGARKAAVLHLSEPLDACGPVSNLITGGRNSTSPVALIEKGGCPFDDKVRRAQEAGFAAAIVYDNEYRDSLVKMLGHRTGVEIPAMFISRDTGQVLKTHRGCLIDIKLLERESALTGSEFVGLCVMLAVAAFIVVAVCARKPASVQSQTFSSADDDKSTSATCTICLEDYVSGDQLMVLPCKHRFHAHCLDKWLSKASCPVCKQSFKSPMETAEEASQMSPQNRSHRTLLTDPHADAVIHVNQHTRGTRTGHGTARFWSGSATERLHVPRPSRALYS